MMLHAINMFGVGCTMVGLGSTSALAQASWEVVRTPQIGRHPADWALIVTLAGIALLDILLVAAGIAVSLVEI